MTSQARADEALSEYDARGADWQRGAGRITLEQISTIMGVLGLGFILIVILVAALNERQTLFREAKDHAQNSAFFLADHAQRLFEVSDVALRTTTLAIGTTDWDTVEQSRPIWSTLCESNALLPYVDDIWLNDATGRLRLTTFAFPATPMNAIDRRIFAEVRNSNATLVIGERIIGKVTHRPTFLVARRLNNPDGSFRGMTSVTLDLTYFTNYWQRLDLPNGERIAVVKADDGEVLTSFGNGAESVTDRKTLGTFLQDAAARPEAGAFRPNRDTYGFYHRVGELPLYLTIEFSRGSVMSAWRDWSLHLLPLALAVFMALISIMLLGRRQGRQEATAARQLAAARAALESANLGLEQRVAERTADLRESNEEIQRFAYIVSHDLRAPLVNIMGFTSELEMLRAALLGPGRDPTPAVRADFDEAIGFIRSSIDKMDRLIKAILTLSREGRRSYRGETIDMMQLLQSIADSVAHRAQTAGTTITIEPLPNVKTDRIAAEQIFSNIIDNAVKYLRPGVPGVVVVSGQRIGDRVLIRVADNGRGIDKKDRERVFELFRRAGLQDQPGEGIGLAHVRALVRHLDGKIALDGTPSGGCVFTVELRDLDGATALRATV